MTLHFCITLSLYDKINNVFKKSEVDIKKFKIEI